MFKKGDKMTKDREEIVKMLPDPMKIISNIYISRSQSEADNEARMYNTALSDTADKLAQRVVRIGELAIRLNEDELSSIISETAIKKAQDLFKEFIILRRTK